MALLSANLLFPNKTLIPSLDLLRNPNLSPTSPLNPILSSPSPKRLAISTSSSSAAAAAAAADPNLQEITKPLPEALSNWSEFAGRVSGEWDGFGAEFTPEGNPIELPESVVPEAFREWGVEVFDWQTQCPTLASESGDPVLCYRLIRLLPTVGCEADAATRYSVEERIAGRSGESRVSALGYDPSGSYVAAWPVDCRGEKKLLEVEHCLVDPANKEVRLRVIQVIAEEEKGLRLEAIRVFSEQWYGPFRNGEQLGGCAIRESGFASSSALKVSDVVGVWQGITASVASFGGEQMEILQELLPSKPQKIVRDQVGLVTLPKQLWCSFKVDDGAITGEVGWLFDHGRAITSRCLLSKDRKLKEMAFGHEIAVAEDA